MTKTTNHSFHLRTVTEQQNDGTVLVYWRSGNKNQGVLQVNVAIKTANNSVIAELYAIEHLIKEKSIFGHLPKRPHGYIFSVSNFDTCRIIRKSPFRYEPGIEQQAAPYTTLFLWRFRGVEVRVSSDKAGIDSGGQDVEQITVDKRTDNGTAYKIESPSMGEVWLTPHAVQRYEQCLAKQNPGNSMPTCIWDTVIRWVKRPDLVEIQMSKQLKRVKDKKYGEDVTQMWGHPSSKIILTTEIQPDGRTVIKTSFAYSYEYNMPTLNPRKKNLVSEEKRLLIENAW